MQLSVLFLDPGLVIKYGFKSDPALQKTSLHIVHTSAGFLLIPNLDKIKNKIVTSESDFYVIQVWSLQLNRMFVWWELRKNFWSASKLAFDWQFESSKLLSYSRHSKYHLKGSLQMEILNVAYDG